MSAFRIYPKISYNLMKKIVYDHVKMMISL